MASPEQLNCPETGNQCSFYGYCVEYVELIALTSQHPDSDFASLGSELPAQLTDLSNGFCAERRITGLLSLADASDNQVLQAAAGLRASNIQRNREPFAQEPTRASAATQ